MTRIVKAALGHADPGLSGAITLGFDATSPGSLGAVFEDVNWSFCNLRVDEELAFTLENRGVPPATMKRMISQVLAQLGMEGFERRHVSTLSGGELRKLALGTVLIGEPQLILTDDLNASLDIEAIDSLDDLLSDHVAKLGAAWVDFTRRPPLRQDGIPKSFATLIHGELQEFDHTRDAPMALAGLKAAVGLPPELAVAEALIGGQAETEASPAVLLETLLARGARLVSRGKSSSTGATAVVRAQGLSFRYRGGRQVLRGCDIELRSGAVQVLAGRNGAGKSTLARILTGLMRPDDGTCIIDNARHSGTALRRAGALVFQNPEYQFIADTVRAELDLAFRAARRHDGSPDVIARELNQIGLADRADDHPFSLSMGERRRLAVAVALSRRPRFVIVDEPTLGQDVFQIRKLGRQLRRAAHDGMAVLLITHDPEFIIEFGDIVLLLQSGRIESLGTPEDAFAEGSGTAFAGRSPLINCWRRAKRAGAGQSFFPHHPEDLSVEMSW